MRIIVFCDIHIYIYGLIDYVVALGFWPLRFGPSLGQILGPPLHLSLESLILKPSLVVEVEWVVVDEDLQEGLAGAIIIGL